MRRERLFAAISAVALCISMMGNVPMVSMAQGSVEVEAETATGSDADFDTGVEAPAPVDEMEDITQEEVREEIIEDEEPSLTTIAGDWEYSDNNDGTVAITKYTGSDTEVVIPEQIDGKTVTGIGNRAFNGCSSLTSIELPSTVTSIGDYTFAHCSNLTSIEIPKGVTSIGDYAFYYCSRVTSIEIPEGVPNIGDCAFDHCSNLTSIEIPEGVTSIGDYAFYYCSRVTSIEIPEGVTSIGNYAFCWCSGLTSIEIPKGVTSIGDYAFEYCRSLTSIEIPEGVTSIGDYAFGVCGNLTSIKIPEGVTSIGNGAFSSCISLTSIEIPEGVASIGNYAFAECWGLTSVEIPSSVTSIESDVFSDCDDLAIYGFSETEAERYAKENNISFVPLCEESDLSKVTIVADSVTYNGDYQNAELYIMYENNKFPLVEGVNYTGTVSRKAAGTTTVTITGIGHYTGEATVSFTVTPLHLKNALEAGDVVLTATDLEYTGRLQQSTVKVTYKGRTLTEGTDYTLKGNGRKAVGTSWAVVTGTGNYKGTIKIKYAMKKASQSNMMVYTKDKRAVDVRTKGATIQLVTSRVRDGAKIVYSVEQPGQGITVSSGGKVTVKKGTKPGKYRIKVLAESTPYYKATSKYFTVVVK